MLMRNERLAALAHRLRRGNPHADDPLGRPRGRARRSAHQGRPAGDRSVLPPLHAAGIARPAQGAVRRRATASPTWRRRWSRSSISPRSQRSRTRRARRSIRCASAAISMSPAGRPGMSSICSAARLAIGRRAAEGRQAHRALRRDRGRSRHRHPRSADPAHADGQFRPHRLRHLCRGDRRRRRSPPAMT